MFGVSSLPPSLGGTDVTYEERGTSPVVAPSFPLSSVTNSCGWKEQGAIPGSLLHVRFASRERERGESSYYGPFDTMIWQMYLFTRRKEDIPLTTNHTCASVNSWGEGAIFFVVGRGQLWKLSDFLYCMPSGRPQGGGLTKEKDSLMVSPPHPPHCTCVLQTRLVLLLVLVRGPDM